jgi:hypothetical protein
MTPLYQAMMRDALVPVRSRRFTYEGCLQGPVPHLDEIRVFEVSAVMDLADRAWPQMARAGLADERTAFLPHPNTWLEAVVHDIHTGRPSGNFAFHLVAADGAHEAVLFRYVMRPVERRIFGQLAECQLPLRGAPAVGRPILWPNVEPDAALFEQGLASMVYALLAMINSPRALARREHAPHKGLERDLRRTGKPGMRPWTEILLELPGGRRIERDPCAAPGASASSAKAEHWVRMHPRFKLGRLEWVTAHKRGDPALGTVQATYRVRPAPTDLPSDET